MAKTIKSQFSTNKIVIQQLEQLATFMTKLNNNIDKLDKKIKILDKRVLNNTSGLKASMLQTEVKLTKLEFKIENIESHQKEFEQKAEDRYGQTITHIDGFAKVFNKADQEQTIISHKQSEHSDRIEKLEEAVFASS